MLLKVIVTVDVDTTDTDIEDMRPEIISEAISAIESEPYEVVIEPCDSF